MSMPSRSSKIWGLKIMRKRIRRSILGFLLLIGACLFLGCKKQETLTFTGTIEEVGETSMMVYTTEVSTADRIWVSFRDLTLAFEPAVGQRVLVTIKPDIGETYPAKADAVEISLEEEELQSQPIAQEHKISAQEAYQKMQQEEGAVVLDVRREEEFAQGHIEGAVLIPLAELVNQAPEKIPDRTATILVYCRSGNYAVQKPPSSLAGWDMKTFLILAGLWIGPMKRFGIRKGRKKELRGISPGVAFAWKPRQFFRKTGFLFSICFMAKMGFPVSRKE